jgi:exosortase
MLLDPPKTHPVAPPAPRPPSATIRGFGPPKPPAIAVVQSPPAPTPTRSAGRPPVWAFVLVGAVVAWAFFPTLDWLVEKWYSDPSYSHGFLVPFIAAYIVYRRRDRVRQWFGTPQLLPAAGLLAAVLLLRGVAGGLLFNQLDALALLVTVATATLAIGGWTLLRNLAPGLAFLIFLVPLPYELEQNVGGPLKVIATRASTFLLQTLGYPAVASGNVIRIREVELGVVDACNGLKMLVTFAAFGGGAVLLLNRSWFEKLLIVLGVVPIALLTNVLRITATGVVFTFAHDKPTQNFVHDAAGLMMMPVGIGFLALQLWVLNRLVVKPENAPLAP